MRPEITTIVIHGYPVKCEWHSDGNVIYHCPKYGCPFQVRYSCKDKDVECRLVAYTQMHDHLKKHLTGPAG
jgi:hypothetical protein